MIAKIVTMSARMLTMTIIRVVFTPTAYPKPGCQCKSPVCLKKRPSVV
jgi:hypothetical protein